MAAKKQTGSIIAYVLVGLFGLPFAVIGLVADLSLIRLGYDDLRMLLWNEVPCTILATELEKHVDGDSTFHRVTAEYGYEVGGIQHTGRRITLLEGGDSSGAYEKKIHAELEQHRIDGTPFRCFVNSRQPDESILYREARWGLAALQTVAALLFSGVGFGLLGALAATWYQDRKRRVTGTGGGNLWQRRADWAAGEIQYSDRLKGTILGYVAGGILLISIPGLLASSAEIVLRGNTLAMLGLIPTGIGLLLQLNSRRMQARWRRYGDSKLQLAAVPGVLGGTLAGVLRVEQHVETPAGFLCRLYCSETTHSTGSDDGASTRVVWEEERTIVRELHSAESEGTAIPILFAIPYELPATHDLPGGDLITWRLSVGSIAVGVDYWSEFEVPVFRTSDSRRNFKLDENPIASYEAPLNSQAPLRKGSLFSEPLDSDGIRLVFPRGRNLGFAFAMALVQAVFAIAIVALCYFKWSVAWPYAAALLGIGMFQAILDLLFYRSEVEVRPTGLMIRGGILNLGAPREIPAAELQKLLLKNAGSAGSTVAQDLFAVLRNGKHLILAKRILPKSAAEEVVRQIEVALGRRQPTADG